MGRYIPLLIIAAAALAVVLACVFRRRAHKKAEEILLNVYINLVELYGYHFWLVSLSRYETDEEIQEKIKKLLHITSDNLRRIRRLKIARETEAALSQLNRDKTPDAAVRYKNLAALIKRLEEYIGSNYPPAAQKIAGLNSEDIFNAAGFIDWKPKVHTDRKT